MEREKSINKVKRFLKCAELKKTLKNPKKKVETATTYYEKKLLTEVSDWPVGRKIVSQCQ